jgi:hypothetical protein
MWNIGPIYRESMYPKKGLVEETTRRGKEGKIVINNEIHHICAGIRHTETC